MITFSHIINPVAASPDSDLFVAQPITFETMRAARELARQQAGAAVDLYAVQIGDEAEVSLPECFVRLAAIDRSVADLEKFALQRNLPLLSDILQALYDAASTEYLIYTNVDIALQPHFYWTVARIIAQGYDALAINRRTIPAHYREVGEIPLMYPELGESHAGWDCFVFKRELFPRLRLGRACIGAGWIGRLMLTNLACLAGNFRIFTDLHLTFHIGNEMAWRSERFSDYLAHNRNEWHRIFLEFERGHGAFDRKSIPGCFLDFFERQAAKESER